MLHDVNADNNAKWPRCKAVRLDETDVVCVLDDSLYSLTEAYRYAPHVRFLGVETPLDLLRFVHTYGPLNGPLKGPESRIPAERYWLFQRKLKAFVKLMDTFKRSKGARDDLRDALLNFLQEDHREQELLSLPYSPQLTKAKLISDQFSLPEEPEIWVFHRDADVIREASAYCIRNGLWVHSGLNAIWRGRRPEIIATFELGSLYVALEWMIWQDVFRQKPLLVCQECGTVVRPKTAHERKYCSHECGHRVAARKWRRRDLHWNRRRDSQR